MNQRKRPSKLPTSIRLTEVRRLKSNERSEDGSAIYKDVCNPITAEFREELYSNILEEYERVQAQGQPEKGTEKDVTPPEFFAHVR